MHNQRMGQCVQNNKGKWRLTPPDEAIEEEHGKSERDHKQTVHSRLDILLEDQRRTSVYCEAAEDRCPESKVAL